MNSALVLVNHLVSEGFVVKIASPDTSDFQVDVMLEDGFIVVSESDVNLDLAVSGAFLETPDLEEARQQADESIPF